MSHSVNWALELSEGSEELRAGKLMGVRKALDLSIGSEDWDSGNGLHHALVVGTNFLAALVSVVCSPGALGLTAVGIISRFSQLGLELEVFQVQLHQCAGLFDALMSTPHVDHALGALCGLSEGAQEAEALVMTTNAALVGFLVATVAPDDVFALIILCNLCKGSGSAAHLYEYPGLIATVTNATRPESDFDYPGDALRLLLLMSGAESLKVSMMRDPLVMDALFRTLGSYVCAVECLENLSGHLENRARMCDDGRIVDAFMARMNYSGSREALVRICYVGTLPDPLPTLDLSLVCSRPFRHQLSLIKALIRFYPKQLSAKDSSDRTPLSLARLAPLPAPVINFVLACLQAAVAEYSLTHLVGYWSRQKQSVPAQRRTLMCCLVHLANAPAQPAVEDERGALNPGKALKFYLNGGKDPFSLIGPFAF
jgi:hypothetical protein